MKRQITEVGKAIGILAAIAAITVSGIWLIIHRLIWVYFVLFAIAALIRSKKIYLDFKGTRKLKRKEYKDLNKRIEEARYQLYAFTIFVVKDRNEYSYKPDDNFSNLKAILYNHQKLKEEVSFLLSQHLLREQDMEGSNRFINLYTQLSERQSYEDWKRAGSPLIQTQTL